MEGLNSQNGISQGRNSYSYLYLILAQLMVGMSIVSSKFLLVKLHIFEILEIRFIIGALFIYLLSKLPSSRESPEYSSLDKKDWALIISQALCAGFLFNILMLMGLQKTNASTAGIIASALPAIVTILSYWFLREKVSTRTWMFVFSVIFGLFLINFSDITSGSIKGSIVGDLIIALSLFPEAAYYVLVKIYNNRLPKFTTAIWMNIINAIVFLPLLLIHWHHHPQIQITLFSGSILIFVGATSALFYVFWNLGSRETANSTSALFTAVMPITTTIIAWLFLNESLKMLQLFGMAIVLVSIILGARTHTLTNNQNTIDHDASPSNDEVRKDIALP